MAAVVKWANVLLLVLREPNNKRSILDATVNDGSLATTKPVSSRSHSPQQKNNGTSAKKLEFVHITKTGGSAIEKAAFLHGVRWGACHFKKIAEVGCSRPDIHYTFPGGSPWHLPPKFAMAFVYKNTSKPVLYHDVDLFTVVRNPYSRMVSEFHCPWIGFKPNQEGSEGVQKTRDKDDPKTLNWWIKDHIRKINNSLEKLRAEIRENAQKSENIKDGTIFLSKKHETYWNQNFPAYTRTLLRFKHFVNQVEYIFDMDGNVMINNILHYENLSEEFNALMQSYGMNITMPSKESGGVFTDTKGTTKKKLTFRDLDEECIQMINEYARSDFEKLGYVMVEKGFDDDYSLEAVH
ncbi:hypothetical protein ACHAXS_001461 [Conticribra weissflogii]